MKYDKYLYNKIITKSEKNIFIIYFKFCFIPIYKFNIFNHNLIFIIVKE